LLNVIRLTMDHCTWSVFVYKI